jgi:hypothetical protein
MREILGQLMESSHDSKRELAALTADVESNGDLDHLIAARLLPGP